MRVFLPIVVLAACSTTKTMNVGPFVRTIEPAPQGINVVTCTISYTVEHTYWGGLFGNNDSKDESLHEGGCMQQVVPTAVAP